MPLEITAELRERLIRKHVTKFWGQDCDCEPWLVERVFGDGMQLVAITPLNTRPNYYLVLVDSKWWMDSYQYHRDHTVELDPEDHIAEHIDEIMEGIEDELGPRWTEDDDRKEVDLGWPGVSDDSGVAWCYAMDLLESKPAPPPPESPEQAHGVTE